MMIGDKHEPDYKTLLEEALDAYGELDVMLDDFLESATVSFDEINASRRLYNRIAEIQRAIGRDFQDIPLEKETV